MGTSYRFPCDYPFWLPDSRYIGFFADNKLKKVAVTGGAAQTLCDAPAGRGGAWNAAGVILFAPTNNGRLSRVSQRRPPLPIGQRIRQRDLSGFSRRKGTPSPRA